MNVQLPPGGVLIGLGCDVIEVERIRGVMTRQGERFLARGFTETERAYCDGMKHRHRRRARLEIGRGRARRASRAAGRT